jgi:hypothetical protein
MYISDDGQWVSHMTTTNGLSQGPYQSIVGFDMTSPANNGGCWSNQGAQSGTPASFMHLMYNNCHDISTAFCLLGGAFNTNGTQSPPVPTTDNWVIGNVVRHGGPTSTSCISTHGIYADGPRDIIQNNIISGFAGWGIHRIANNPGIPLAGETGGYFPGAISNNTIFNNGGGILLSEQNNAGFQATLDFTTVSNNIIVNNGGSGSQCGYGLNFFHVTGTHNLVTNNLIYGNLGVPGSCVPGDLAHHSAPCGTNASGSTPATGPAIDGTDSNTTGGCPSSNPQTDAGGVTATFTAFHTDFNNAPDGSYSAQHYIPKPTSNAVNKGATNCASSPGITPCTPAVDFNQVNRPIGPAIDIGAFEQ